MGGDSSFANHLKFLRIPENQVTSILEYLVEGTFRKDKNRTQCKNGSDPAQSPVQNSELPLAAVSGKAHQLMQL
jgi:hypothetical protein